MSHWTREAFQAWAQANILLPEMTEQEASQRFNAFGDTMVCEDIFYDRRRIPLPGGWCEHCNGKLPKYQRWKLKVWRKKEC